MKKTLAALAALILIIPVYAQQSPPENWFNLDKRKDGVLGVSTEKAYGLVSSKAPAGKVIVAVIDGGTDTEHEDLKELIWVNPKEIPGNGVDDDRNGYADDIHGWSFIGGKDGDVNEDNLEVTRVYQKWKPLYEHADTTKLDAARLREYRIYEKARTQYENETERFGKMNEYYGNLVKDMERITKRIGKEEPATEDLRAFNAQTGRERVALKVMEQALKEKKTIREFTASVKEVADYCERRVKVHLNMKLDTRRIVNDNENDPTERHYGNNHVIGPRAEHGTHVAGIIAAVRNNGKGINGVCNSLQIMVLRVVPDGDERDKDVANAIRYAVDNGASIINMSFGKSFSPDKKVVDDAVKYAVSKDVLLIHASGNDEQDNDVEDNFPKAVYFSGETASTWIEVGASSWKKKKEAVAEFSNYGRYNVDVLAPGKDIYSCLPNSTYGTYSGTSMAAPVVSGVAAMIRSYYPNLTAAEVKDILLRTTTRLKGKVYLPGDRKKKVKPTMISRTGGVVNAYQAMKMAAEKSKVKGIGTTAF